MTGTSEKAVRDLVNLSKKQAKDNDDLLVFQTLLQKWQDDLSVQRSSTEDFQMTMMCQKRSYARVINYKSPTIMMSMLNTHTTHIAANARMSVFRNPEGLTYCLGKDFRKKKEDQDERQFGVPRCLNLRHPVDSIALGKDHALLLTSESQIFSFGSNEFGQLGIAYGLNGEVEIDKEMLRHVQEFEHPITCDTLTYSSEPVPVVFFEPIDQIK